MSKKERSIGSVRTLTVAAMLTAMSVVIGIFCKNFLNFGNGLFRITFENLPIIISGVLFGPAVGGAVGAISDILSYILSTQSFAISPIVTLGATLVGVVSGLVSRLMINRGRVPRIALSAALAHIAGSIIVKSIELYIYYGVAVLYRIPLYAVIATVEIIIICQLYKNKAFRQLLDNSGDKK